MKIRILKMMGSLVLGIWCLESSAFAADRYIRAGATGANNGTSWTNAWTSFSAVTWTRGDTYYVASGVYPGNVSISCPVNGALRIAVKKATTDVHGTSSDWSDSYASGQAVIQGGITNPGGYNMPAFAIFSSHIDVDGVTGTDNAGHGIKVKSTACSYGESSGLFFLTPGIDSVHVSHVEMEGCGFGTYDRTSGFYQNSLSDPSIDIRVSHCWIHDITMNGVTLGRHEGTSFAEGSIGFLFENNRVERSGYCLFEYPGWHSQGIQIFVGPQVYAVYRNNKFVDITGTGYIAYLGDTIVNNVRIYNNLFYSNNPTLYEASPGVITFLASAGSSVNNVQIHNNTFNNISIKGVTNWVAGGTGNELKNNLFANCAFSYGNIGFALSNNAFYNITINTSQPWRPNTEPASQIETVNPFVNAPGYDFHINPTALSKDQGADLSAIFTTDMEGLSRPQGPGWDIGAYEYKGCTPDNAPNIFLLANPISGTEPLMVDFDASRTEACIGSITGFNWNFGDGTSGSDAITQHTFPAGTYIVTLTVSNSSGLNASAQRIISAYRPGEVPPDPPVIPPSPGTISQPSDGGSVSINVPSSGDLEVTLFDRQGRRIKTLWNGEAPSSGLVSWNGKNESGSVVASGIYSVLIKSSGKVEKRKLVVVK